MTTTDGSNIPFRPVLSPDDDFCVGCGDCYVTGCSHHPSVTQVQAAAEAVRSAVDEAAKASSDAVEAVRDKALPR